MRLRQAMAAAFEDFSWTSDERSCAHQPEGDLERHFPIDLAMEQADGAIDRDFSIEQPEPLARFPEARVKICGSGP